MRRKWHGTGSFHVTDHLSLVFNVYSVLYVQDAHTYCVRICKVTLEEGYLWFLQTTLIQQRHETVTIATVPASSPCSMGKLSLGFPLDRQG